MTLYKSLVNHKNSVLGCNDSIERYLVYCMLSKLAWIGPWMWFASIPGNWRSLSRQNSEGMLPFRGAKYSSRCIRPVIFPTSEGALSLILGLSKRLSFLIQSSFIISEGKFPLKELDPIRTYVSNFTADDMSVTWVSRFWDRLTTWMGTHVLNTFNPPSLSVGWDHICCGTHFILCLSSIWIHWSCSRSGEGWRSRIGFWENRNEKDVLSAFILIRLHCFSALFPSCELEILLVRRLPDKNYSLHFLWLS